MNTKLLILLLFFIISETFCICLLGFVFGYLVGYYSYEYVTAKRGRNEIHQFFLSYNRKNGIAISTIRKPQFK